MFGALSLSSSNLSYTESLIPVSFPIPVSSTFPGLESTSINPAGNPPTSPTFGTCVPSA